MVYESSVLLKQFNLTITVSTIPKTVVTFDSIRMLIINEKHFITLAVENHFKLVIPVAAFYSPCMFHFPFFKVEFLSYTFPKVSEVKVVLFSFMIHED